MQSWLEQDTSCPTCRLALSVQHNAPLHPNIHRIDDTETPGRTNNHFFHFNFNVSWLPNFSVEVTHINAVLREHQIAQTAAHTSQIRNMARQVQQMFPRYPISIIISDLQLSRSMEITIDNILEGRLQIPARFQNEFESDTDDFGDPNGQQGNSGGGGGGGALSSQSNNNDNGDHTYATLNSPSDYYVNPADFSQGSSSSDSGYEIERNSNIFGNQNELLRDDRFVYIFFLLF